MGVGKDYLVTPGHPDRLGRGRNRWGPATEFLQKVHQHGLVAHCWTFKNEWNNMYWENGQDPYSEMEEFLQLGVDGFFTDFPLSARLVWEAIKWQQTFDNDSLFSGDFCITKEFSAHQMCCDLDCTLNLIFCDVNKIKDKAYFTQTQLFSWRQANLRPECKVLNSPHSKELYWNSVIVGSQNF